MPTETRTLGDLQAAVAALDPGARLRDLTQQLVALNDRLRHVETDYSAETNPGREALLVAELETLRANQQDVRILIATERHTINRRAFAPTDHDALRAAIAHRTKTIYAEAIGERPEWLIELLNELDDRGTLEQLRPRQLHRLVLEEAKIRDLGLDDPAMAAKGSVERTPARAI